MESFEKKLVAVMNKSVEPGVIMNALAHMCIGFGAHVGSDALHLMTYIDKDGGAYPNISKMPFIILRGTGGKIGKLIHEAQTRGIAWSAFTDTMTIGSWKDQEERTQSKNTDELIFYGIVLYGDWDTVTELTRKFSLWK